MRRTQLALVLAGVAALAFGGTALAAKTRSHPHGPAPVERHHAPHAPLAAAAGYLGLTPQALLTQLRSGKTLAQIANATSGKSASGLVDALVTDLTSRLGGKAPPDLRQRITDLVNGARPPFRRLRPRLPGLDVAATYLGVSLRSLLAQLRGGKTLAQVVDATSGKSTAGLVDALVAAATSRLGGNAPPDLRQRITDLVNGTLRPHRPPHPWAGAGART